MTKSIHHKAINALKWSFLTEIISKVLPPLLFLVMARLLTPEDFGIVAAATIVISFSQVFWDAGLGQALIQRENDLADASNVVFWTNLFLGIVVFLILFVLAPYIAELFFKEERASAVIRVQSVILIIRSLCSVQTARFQRNFDFKSLFWIRIITTVIPGIISIPLALTSMGYWALVYGNIGGNIVQCILLWKFSHWHPKLKYNIVIAKELLRFGFWIIASGMLIWFYTWCDSLIIGAFLGSKELGIYRVGSTFVIMVFGILLAPISTVAYSTFSRYQNDLNKLSSILVKATKTIVLISFPVGVGLFIIKTPLAAILFGAKWQGVDVVIGYLGVSNGISWMVGLGSFGYRAIGKPNIETKIMIIGLLIYFPVYYYAIKFGLNIFIYSRLAVSVIVLPVHFYFLRKYFNLAFFKIMNTSKTILAALFLMLVVASCLSYCISSLLPAVQMVILMIVSIIIYGTIIFLFDKVFLLNQVSTILKKGK